LDHPDWQLAKNESGEFSFWMSGTGDPGDEDRRQFERLPRQRRHLVKCLRLPPSSNSWHEDDWSEICRDKLSTAACALCALAHEDTWPAKRWRDALEAWSEGKLLRRSWRYLAATLQRMPDDTLLVVGQAGTRWLKAVAKILDRDEAVFLALCHRFLAMDHEDDETTEELVTRAVNHPVGHITQALLAYCFSRQPEDGQRLPNGLAQLFDMLCDPEVAQYRHARVLLAANVIALFRVDQDWTTRCLLPLFNWQRSVIEARATWEGFLWSPRLYRPLLAALKNDFLDTALHYREFVKSALFVDFDNVFTQLRALEPAAAERFARAPVEWMRWLVDRLEVPDGHPDPLARRRVLVRRCYLNPNWYQQYRHAFLRAGFEIVDCPPVTSQGKTSTDIHMVLDIIELLQHETRYDEFIVLSADADFTPVLRKLRRYDRRTSVLAIGFPSAAYQASADLLIDASRKRSPNRKCRSHAAESPA
jgi:hypothetical protein